MPVLALFGKATTKIQADYYKHGNSIGFCRDYVFQGPFFTTQISPMLFYIPNHFMSENQCLIFQTN